MLELYPRWKEDWKLYKLNVPAEYVIVNSMKRGLKGFLQFFKFFIIFNIPRWKEDWKIGICPFAIFSLTSLTRWKEDWKWDVDSKHGENYKAYLDEKRIESSTYLPMHLSYPPIYLDEKRIESSFLRWPSSFDQSSCSMKRGLKGTLRVL